MRSLRHAPVLLAVLLVAVPVGASCAAAAAAPSATPKQAAHSVLPFIDDDLPRALAEAKRRDLPLFVESWAPW